MSSIEQLRSLLGEIQELEIRLRQIEALYLSYLSKRGTKRSTGCRIARRYSLQHLYRC